MLPLAGMTLSSNSSTMPVVLLEHLALEHPEALDGVRAPAHVHARLVELQLDAPGEQAIGRDLDRHAEIHGEVRPDGKAVELADPAPVDAARGVARERRVGVAVGEHDHAGLERRDDVVEQPVGEVGRVQQAERHRRQRVLLLARLGRGLDERRRVPLGDEDRVAGGAKPLRQQRQLRCLSRPVDAFDHEQLSRVLVARRQVVQHERSVRGGRSSSTTRPL